MQFLIQEMWTWFAALFVLGATVMWTLGWVRSRARIARLTENWQIRLRSVEDAANSRLRSAEQAFNARLEEEDSIAAALRTDLQSQMARATSLADEVARWKSEAEELQTQVRDHESARELGDARLRMLDERLSVALDDADKLDVELKRLREEHAELSSSHSALETQASLIPVLEARIQELEGTIRDLEETVQDREGRIRELEALEDALREVREELALREREHAGVLSAKDEEVDRLRGRIGDLEPRAARVEVLIGQVAERTKKVNTLESRLAALDGCPDRLRASQDELAGLRREAREIEAREQTLAGQTTALETDLGKERARAEDLARKLDSMREAHAAVQAEATRLREQAARNVRDDLKRIHGIGPKLESTLYGMGYRTYRQIANWSDEDIGRVEDHLGDFADRIKRDDWIGQARRLTRETNGVDISL